MSLAVARVPHDWSERRSAGAPSARSLLFTVLGEFVLPAGGVVWSGALISAFGALGVEEKAARQAITRTAADGWLTRTRAGRRVRLYLTDAGRELLATGAERIYGFGGSQDDWDGRFILLFVNEPNGGREVRRRLQTRLAWAGFGQVRAGTWIAAHVERDAEARAVLSEFGIGDKTVSFVAQSGEIGDPSGLFEEAWNLDALADRYGDFIDVFEPMRPATGEEVFVALTRLVHEWRKFPFLDPGLPSRLLPARWSGARAKRLFRRRRRVWERRAHDWFDAQSPRVTF